MTGSDSAFLVDTNVLVYAYDNVSAVKRQTAIDVLEELGRSKLGALSVQVLGEFFSVSTRKLAVPLTREAARDAAIRYARSWRMYDLTAAIVLDGMRTAIGNHLSYWDGLLCATARHNGIPNLITEDLNGGQLIEGVRIINPFDPSFDMRILS